MSRTIGGNPLRNAAIRQGNLLPAGAGKTSRLHPWPVASTRHYTETDRQRLLAPIVIRSFGGKSWGGAFPANHGETFTKCTYANGRYGYSTDWTDLDGMGE